MLAHLCPPYGQATMHFQRHRRTRHGSGKRDTNQTQPDNRRSPATVGSIAASRAVRNACLRSGSRLGVYDTVASLRGDQRRTVASAGSEYAQRPGVRIHR